MYDTLDSISVWDAESIHGAIEQVTQALEVGMGKVGQPLRVAITGGSFSPPIDVTAEMVGRERVLARIQRALAHISAQDGAENP